MLCLRKTEATKTHNLIKNIPTFTGIVSTPLAMVQQRWISSPIRGPLNVFNDEGSLAGVLDNGISPFARGQQRLLGYFFTECSHCTGYQ